MRTLTLRLTILFVCILAFGSESGANQIKNTLKRGTELERQGQYFRASTNYLVVLRLEPGNRNARAALTRIIDQATAEKLDAAAAFEAELRIDEAIVEIDAAQRLLEQSASFGIEGGQTKVVESRRSELVNRRVQTLLTEAERALNDGLRSAALSLLQRVESLRPGDRENRERMRGIWEEWAETNVREGRLLEAAERLEEAARIPGERSGANSARAAVIRSALGMSELSRGACRAAVAELRSAEKTAPGSVESGALEQAEACARTCMDLRVTGDAESGLNEQQLGHLRAEVRRHVASGASEFLVVRDPSTRTRLSCDQRLVPGINGQPMNVGPYSASVRITAFGIVRQPATSSTRQTQSLPGIHAETVVTYQQYTEVLSGTLSGWVTVTDQRAGGAGLQIPVRVTDEALSRWRGNAVSASTYRSGPGAVAPRPTTGVVIGGPGGGRAEADEARRQARSSLTERLVHDFADQAARLLLTAVDAEPAVPDPTDLPRAEMSMQ